jgi:serine/threonine protein kinase
MEFNFTKRKKIYTSIINYIKKEKKRQDDKDSIRSSFRIGKKLGEGVQGIVYKVYSKTYPIVLKRSNISQSEYKLKDKIYSKDTLKLPPYIELACLTLVNQLVLQRICPNFTINYHNEILNTCNKEPNISYRKHCTIQYNEFVNYGTFEDWAKKNHKQELWYNAIFQILAALYAMHKYYNLFHNDFHGRNLLVQKVKPGGYWTYIIDGTRYYVPNLGFVFLISDFGFGWIPNVMYPEWYIRKNIKHYSLIDSMGTKLTTQSRLTWDIYKLKKITINPLLKVSKKIPKYFKEQFLGILDILITSNEENITLGDIINILYGSTIVSKKECTDYPNYCYNNKKFAIGSRIETYNMDKKLNTKPLPKDLLKLLEHYH